MIGDEKTRQLLQNYYNAAKFNNKKEIETSKYELLCDANNLFEIVINYVFLSQKGFNFDFGESIISKNTVFYRIRKFDENTDFSKSSEWTPPPHKPENRANRKGETALYVASNEEICLCETHIKQGEKYAVAKYKCIDDIRLGGFLSIAEGNNIAQLIAGIALNAFLIAPARGKNNKDLFDCLQSLYGDIQLADVRNWQKSFDLPYRFALLNKRETYYKLTNQLCDNLKKRFPDGIRYSSCYMPVETIGIKSNAFNVCLYGAGINKVCLLDYKIKTNTSNISEIEIAKIINGIQAKNE